MVYYFIFIVEGITNVSLFPLPIDSLHLAPVPPPPADLGGFLKIF